MRLCLLGDSHLAPVRDAWGELGSTGDVEAVFVGAPKDLLGRLAVSNGALRGPPEVAEVMERVCGVTEVVADEFDAFAIVGLRLEVAICCRLFATHRTWRAGSEDAAPEVQFVSRECLLDATKEGIEQTIAVSLARKLRAVTSAPIVLVAHGGHSEVVIEQGARWRELLAAGYGSEIRDIFTCACEEFPEDFEILGPPPETVVQEIFTRREYCSLRHAPDDPTRRDTIHMNVKYGHSVISQLLSGQHRFAQPSP
jgi:hypothetical protein